uniref:DNA gyrase subunit Bic/mitochondrial-like n=1 Tax=Rhizophora mucronata TaxID=61149 RepID=A0A2P2LWT4_RHIMU
MLLHFLLRELHVSLFCCDLEFLSYKPTKFSQINA